MNDSTDTANSVGIARIRRSTMYWSISGSPGAWPPADARRGGHAPSLLFDEELLRVDQTVVAEGIVLDKAVLHIAEVFLHDEGLRLLSNDPDRVRMLLMNADQLLEVGISLRFVRLGLGLFPELPDLPDRVVRGRLL